MRVKTVITSDVEHKLRGLIKDLKKSEKEVVISMAKTTSREIANIVLATGLNEGGNAKKTLEGSVAKDVDAAYDSTIEVYMELKEKSIRHAAGWLRAMNEGDYLAASHILDNYRSQFQFVTSANMGSIQEMRVGGKKGHIPDGTPPLIIEGSASSSQSEYEEVMKKAKERAGLVKASWLQAGMTLAGRSVAVPRWLKAKMWTGSYSTETDGKNGYEVELVSGLDYASNVTPHNRMLEAAGRAYKKTVTYLERALERATKNF